MELRGSGSTIGYRQITQRLSRIYVLCVDKDTVRNLRILDPEGVEASLNIVCWEGSTKPRGQITYGS